MAHYAFLDENNIVTEVITGKDETELIDGVVPEIWYSNFRGQLCKRTSYNTFAGENKTGRTPFRKNYAGIGFIYDSIRDAFYVPQPYPSWKLNEETCIWEAPIPMPVEQDNFYLWDEENTAWFLPPEKPDSSTAWYWDMQSRQWSES
jgi:hypothetical protein